ncbi:hypothetical protein BYT27DRAFT_7264560 [Phlegmacium glaucopus]|nr:hypothetical protein BYT27DRAFT_7264560 [Phlegmacium glaucopus]
MSNDNPDLLPPPSQLRPIRKQQLNVAKLHFSMFLPLELNRFSEHFPWRTFSSTPPKSASINNFQSRKCVASPTVAIPETLALNRGGGKHQAKQKAGRCTGTGRQSYGSDLARDHWKGQKAMSKSDVNVGMDSEPREMETDMEVMRTDSPTIQFAAYAQRPDDESNPFATPQPSATMSVDSSPLSSITNSSLIRGRKGGWLSLKKRLCVVV